MGGGGGSSHIIPVLQKERGMDAIKSDHEGVIAPTLPADINIPTQLLPTTDLEGAGTLSPGCSSVKVEKGKDGRERKADSAGKKGMIWRCLTE